jgi:hypothetical protein
MQQAPLLERLDWYFTSQGWTLKFPETIAHPLTMTTCDQTPCVISIKTNIPKSQVFRFKNYWVGYDDFLPLVESVWNNSIFYQDAAKRITAKFKILSCFSEKMG